jgi:hypothetical protein
MFHVSTTSQTLTRSLLRCVLVATCWLGAAAQCDLQHCRRHQRYCCCVCLLRGAERTPGNAGSS